MIDRREFLKMMAMCGVYGAFNRLSGNLLAAPVERKREPARSVIEIWVWGGPSHLETFDPNPMRARRTMAITAIYLPMSKV